MFCLNAVDVKCPICGTINNLMGQRFTGKAVAAEQVGGFPAVRVEISGTAYKTGSCTFLIDDNDPLTYGFPFHA